MERFLQIIREFWARELPDVKPRQYDRAEFNSARVNEIIGVRRCGKTYLMYRMIKDLPERRAAVYVSFEDRRLYPLTPASLDNVLKVVYAEELHKKYPGVYLFLDEVQNVPEWERFVRNVHDDPTQRIKVVVSGSNARLLSEEYGRLLTGRHLPIRLHPLSFAEFLSFRGISNGWEQVVLDERETLLQRVLLEYLENGGFPEIVLGKGTKSLLQQYYSDILARDVMARERPRKSASLVEAIGKYLVTNIATPTSLRRLKTAIERPGTRISTPTVGRYIEALERAFLVFGIPKFSFRLRNQMQQPHKYYCIDTGLRNAVSFRFSADLGRLYENVVAVELLRRAKDVYYWKDRQQHEVDFVVQEGRAVRFLIQVCAHYRDPRVRERELRALAHASGELRCRDCLVITQDQEGVERYESRGHRLEARLMPLWKWLLNVTS